MQFHYWHTTFFDDRTASFGVTEENFAADKEEAYNNRRIKGQCDIGKWKREDYIK